MTNGIFKRLDKGAHARAANVMSTESATGFEWSVKLIGGSAFSVGIASHLRADEVHISQVDKNSILYLSWLNCIKQGSNAIHSHLPKHKNEDVIRFRFQPNAKKFAIDLVRF